MHPMAYISLIFDIALTLYLLVASAENFCKQFGYDQVQQTVGSDLDQNYLTPQSKKLETKLINKRPKTWRHFKRAKSKEFNTLFLKST